MRTEPVDRVAEVISGIEALAPLFAEHRDALDRDRRLPKPIFLALADAGLFRLWLPESLGGPGFSPLEFMEIVEAASVLDGAVGWLVGNGGGMSRAAGHLPEEIAREWFSDHNTFIVAATGAVGKADRCDGGYCVSGRWPFGSGAPHGLVSWVSQVYAVAKAKGHHSAAFLHVTMFKSMTHGMHQDCAALEAATSKSIMFSFRSTTPIRLVTCPRRSLASSTDYHHYRYSPGLFPLCRWGLRAG